MQLHVEIVSLSAFGINHNPPRFTQQGPHQQHALSEDLWTPGSRVTRIMENNCLPLVGLSLQVPNEWRREMPESNYFQKILL